MSERNTIFDIQPGFRREHIWIIASVPAIYFLLRTVMPTDLYTTAAWLDGLGRPSPWSGAVIDDWPYRFLNGLAPMAVSVEGMTFSVLITLAQFMMTLKTLSAGSWLVSGQDPGLPIVLWRLLRHAFGKSGGIRPEQLNGKKMGYFIAWLCIVCFDAGTSLAYRMNGQSASELGWWSFLVISLTYALLYENILSEIMLGESVRGLLAAIVIILFSPAALRGLWEDVANFWKGFAGEREPRQSKSNKNKDRRPERSVPQSAPPPRPDRPNGSPLRESRPDRPSHGSMPPIDMGSLMMPFSTMDMSPNGHDDE